MTFVAWRWLLRLSDSVLQMSPGTWTGRRRPRRVDLVGLEPNRVLRILAARMLLHRQTVVGGHRRSVGPQQGWRRTWIFLQTHRASVTRGIVDRCGRCCVRPRRRLRLAALRRRMRLRRSVNEGSRVGPRRGCRHVEVVPRSRGLFVRTTGLLGRGVEPTTVVFGGRTNGSKRWGPLLSCPLKQLKN